jgi:putative DNA-binding protein
VTAAVSLAHFQEDFVRALLAPDHPAAPAFSVYRNTVLKGCIDALQANYPAVARLVGEEWFRAAAAVYARLHPPRVPMLVEYGAGYPDFLARFEPAADLPYLPAVAALDRRWTEAHIAADEPALDARLLEGLNPERLGSLRLRPHAAARWGWFAEGPIYTIWSRNRADGIPVADLHWRAEGALLVRPHDAVAWLALGAEGCAFLDACAAGRTLAEAAEDARATDPATDVAALVATLLGAGAFAHLNGEEHP